MSPFTHQFRCIYAHLDAVNEVCVVVALLVRIRGCKHEKVVVSGVRGFGVALAPLCFQLEEEEKFKQLIQQKRH